MCAGDSELKMQQNGKARSKKRRFDVLEHAMCHYMDWRAHQSKEATYQKSFHVPMTNGPIG